VTGKTYPRNGFLRIVGPLSCTTRGTGGGRFFHKLYYADSSLGLPTWHQLRPVDAAGDTGRCTHDRCALAGLLNLAFFTQPEWAAAFVQDPTGENGLLLPVRVRECDAPGLLPQLVYIDLVGVDEDRATAVLLAGAQKARAKPTTPPKFPGSTPKEKPLGPRFPRGLRPIWNIPHNRNPNFPGRERLLSEIEANLSASDQTVLNQTIGGLGGIGKTQAAAKYAYRHAA